MSFNKNSLVQDNEFLYRAFHLLEWHHGENRPNSGVFQSSDPISVDRDGERKDNVVIEAFRNRPNYKLCGLVKHSAQFYRECETEPVPDPEDNNQYHALVNGIGIKGTKKKHARKLCRNYTLVIMAE